jgi:hypothetical protein
MKRFFLCLLAFLPAMAFAQTAAPFTIKAKVGKLDKPAQAFLAYQLGANTVIDSATIVNGGIYLHRYHYQPGKRHHVY